MMPRMAEETPSARLTESLPGRLSGWLLAVLWIVAMTAVDSNAFSSFPACIALACVLLLVAAAVLCGRRLVRMSLTGWVSLALGGYFLVRCICSYAVVDSWCEQVLIMGGIIYYVAGVYVAQNRRYHAVFMVLAAALVLNLVAFYITRQPEFALEWTGRARYTPAGENHIPCTLFVYKNFAGVFLSLGGCVLAAWAVWCQRGVNRVLLLLLAVAAVGVSFMCGTRAVYLVLPLALLLLWGLWAVLRVCSGKKISVGVISCGVLLMVLGGVGAYELLFGNKLMAAISNVNSHLRYFIWGAACEVLPSVPLWGCGANVAQWELLPFYSEWQHPNYVHNEYLQLWVDYGPVGVLAVVAGLVLHVVRGLRCIMSEYTEKDRRVLTVLALVSILGIAVYAVSDYPWHSFSLVSFSSFACGVLASPFTHHADSWFSGRKWRSGQAPLAQVRAQKWPGKALLLVVAVGLLVENIMMSARLYPAWSAQWEYNELSRPGADPSGDARREFIARLLPQYPSPALMDTYVMLPPPRYNDFARKEQLLKLAHTHNPGQLYTVTMLVDTLGAQGKCAESELLMRRCYPVGGMRRTLQNNWPAYYAYNLLLRGRQELQQGNQSTALSMLLYGLRMNERNGINFNVVHRQGEQPWKKHGGIKPNMQRFISSCWSDVRLLRLIGTEPDDSWKAPMEPGGQPALYQALGEKARP